MQKDKNLKKKKKGEGEPGHVPGHAVGHNRPWIQEPVFKPRKYIGIIDSIKELISRDWIVSFALTCREGNQCADFMAKVGANVMDCLRIFPEPPACLGSLLLSDAMRTPYTRFE
jgi:hypothetical protein